MRTKAKAYLLLFMLTLASCLGGTGAQAQFARLHGAGTIALKSGETIELGQAYWVVNCRTYLNAPPDVEVLDGPPEISVSVKETMVLPRREGCTKRVAGGTVSITAKEIEDPSYTRLTLRFSYKTKDGIRKSSSVVNLQLLP
jgi:hypothetical protein